LRANLVKRLLLIVLVILGRVPAAQAQVQPRTPRADSPEVLSLPAPGAKSTTKETEADKKKAPLGQLVQYVTAPWRLVFGWHRQPAETSPAIPTLEDIAKMTPGTISPAQSTAAKIKAEEDSAAARRAAVRYLGAVDYHYYPEAERALIAALRADRNEWVRMEAAIALGNGSCATRRTAEALNLVLIGSDQDGNPAETSARVKAAALTALQQCQARGAAAPPLPEGFRSISRKPGAPANLQLTGYVNRVESTRPSSASAAERAFAESAGSPVTTSVAGQRATSAPARATSSPSRLSGLTPIGAIPGE
jgi:hypothetical protein